MRKSPPVVVAVTYRRLQYDNKVLIMVLSCHAKRQAMRDSRNGDGYFGHLWAACWDLVKVLKPWLYVGLTEMGIFFP